MEPSHAGFWHAPPDAMQAPDIEPVVIRHIAQELARRGADVDAVLHPAGLTRALLDDQSLAVTFAQTSAVVRAAIGRLGEPHLGLHLGCHVNLVSWELCYLGLMACADSDQLLGFAADFLPSSANILHLHVQRTGARPVLVAINRFDDDVLNEFIVDKTFAAIARTWRSVLGPSRGPVALRLTRHRPGDETPYARAFGCPVAFGCEDNAMSFPAERIPVPSADPVALRRAVALLQARRTPARAVHPLALKIALSLRGRLREPPPMEEMALALNMSERTLRRRLAELAVTYAELLDRERRAVALPLLRQPGRPLAEVAWAAGFSGPRSLRRALKRWNDSDAPGVTG